MNLLEMEGLSVLAKFILFPQSFDIHDDHEISDYSSWFDSCFTYLFSIFPTTVGLIFSIYAHVTEYD